MVSTSRSEVSPKKDPIYAQWPFSKGVYQLTGVVWMRLSNSEVLRLMRGAGHRPENIALPVEDSFGQEHLAFGCNVIEIESMSRLTSILVTQYFASHITNPSS